MLKLTGVSLWTGGLALALASLGILGATGLGYVWALFPGAHPAGEVRFDLISALDGRISQSGNYWTSADRRYVSRWYSGVLGLETPPDDIANTREGCLTAVGTQRLAFVRRSIQTTLCARPSGTSIFVYQTVYLRR